MGLYVGQFNINSERVARRPATTVEFHGLPLSEWINSVNVSIIYWSAYVKHVFVSGIVNDKHIDDRAEMMYLSPY